MALGFLFFFFSSSLLFLLFFFFSFSFLLFFLLFFSFSFLLFFLLSFFFSFFPFLFSRISLSLSFFFPFTVSVSLVLSTSTAFGTLRGWPSLCCQSDVTVRLYAFALLPSCLLSLVTTPLASTTNWPLMQQISKNEKNIMTQWPVVFVTTSSGVSHHRLSIAHVLPTSHPAIHHLGPEPLAPKAATRPLASKRGHVLRLVHNLRTRRAKVQKAIETENKNKTK